MINPEFWHGKKVFITGHTGFKGAWLSLWLCEMGAEVVGFALNPPTTPSLFEELSLSNKMVSVIGDIRDYDKLLSVFNSYRPEIVIHMAAQPLVRESYLNPLETYSTNVMGTAHLLEAVRVTGCTRAVVNVTTDKCYENKEWVWGYREDEPLGGFDPYSNSKACSELVTASYRNSFFNPDSFDKHRVAIATARAGNVIGGGDWAKERLIPDCIRSLSNGEPIVVRNPHAIRPWQHVLEPLGGYLMLAERLYADGIKYAQAWNFGPADEDAKEVQWIVEKLCHYWKNTGSYQLDQAIHPHEARYLKLDCSKSKQILGWRPRWSLKRSLKSIVEWNEKFINGEDTLEKICLDQIRSYINTPIENEDEI